MTRLTYNPVGFGNIIQLYVQNSPTNWQAMADSSDSTVVVTGDGGGYHYDLYEILATPLSPRDRIDGVTVFTRCDTTAKDSTYNKSRAAIFTHGTLYVGAEQSHYWHEWYEQVWLDASDTWALNPYTGAEWTWDEIVNLQIGVGLLTNAGYSRCAKVSAAADYTTRRIVGRSQIIGGW